MRTSSTTTLRQPPASTSGVRGAEPPEAGTGPARYPQARHHVVAPLAASVADAAAASVFGAARLRGPIARDVIAQVTQLSIATVNRQVTALLDAGILRERADLAVSGAIGRPRVPVEVNHEPFLTLGIHIGARTTSIVATDLFGRTLDAVETPTPRGAQAAALASLAGSARRYLSRWHRRRPLWVGVAAGRRRRQHHRTPRPLSGWAGPTPRSAPCWPRRSACRCRWLRTSTRWRAPNCCSGCAAKLHRRPACTSTPARPSATRCRSAGGCTHQPAARHHRRAARPLGTARRQRPARVHGQRRGGADRRPARRASSRPMGPRVDGDGRAAVGPAGQPAGSRAARRARAGARRSGRAAARHAQPRRSGGRRPGVHRVPRGHGLSSRPRTPSVRCCLPATSGSPRSVTGCRKPAPGWCRSAGSTPTRSGRCGAHSAGLLDRPLRQLGLIGRSAWLTATLMHAAV